MTTAGIGQNPERIRDIPLNTNSDIRLHPLLDLLEAQSRCGCHFHPSEAVIEHVLQPESQVIIALRATEVLEVFAGGDAGLAVLDRPLRVSGQDVRAEL